MSEDIKMVQTALDGIKGQLDAKLADHTAMVEKHGKATTELTGTVDKLAQKYAEAEAKLNDLCQKAAGGFTPEQRIADSIGAQFMASNEVKNFMKSQSGSVKLEIKNTIIGEAGSPKNPSDIIVAPDRRDGIVPGAFRALTILDVVPMGSTGSNQVHYTQEDAFTNSSAEVAESGANFVAEVGKSGDELLQEKKMGEALIEDTKEKINAITNPKFNINMNQPKYLQKGGLKKVRSSTKAAIKRINKSLNAFYKSNKTKRHRSK
jgi:hypothetical protein